MASTRESAANPDNRLLEHLPMYFSPNLSIMILSFPPPDPCLRVEPTEDGDYRLCFDNSYSKLSEKMVFFEVIVEAQGGDARGGEEFADMAEPESMVEYKLEDIRVRGTEPLSPSVTGLVSTASF